jgi:hypothetical protein
MTLQIKQAIVAVLSLFFLASLLVVAWIEGGKHRVGGRPAAVVSGDNKGCVSCHQDKTPVIVAQWKDSMHAPKGVGCIECHGAEKDQPDAFRHEGAYIATIVSPKDCSRCHEKETGEFASSHHAKAAQFVGSLDNVLGELAEGPMAAANGCWQCHGSTVSFVKDSAGNVVRDDAGKPKFDPATWPNTGIGRVNLDGSLGACSHLPFETWILPKLHQPSFGLADGARLRPLAEILKTVLQKLHVGLENPDFNLTINTVPRGDEDKQYFLWHVQILPRLTTPTGFELGSGMSINTVLPEDAADFLRAVEVK